MMHETAEMTSHLSVDACELACPLPLLKAKQGLNQLTSGQILYLCATDPASQRDIPAFCRISGHHLMQMLVRNNQYCYWLRKR